MPIPPITTRNKKRSHASHQRRQPSQASQQPLTALLVFSSILKVGEADAKASGDVNTMAQIIHEADGLSKIEQLQQHQTESIYNKAVKILETYFGAEEEDEQVAPQTQGQQFAFGGVAQPPGGGGFNFGGPMG